ncbi:MAG: hypothetical protein FH749_01260 [Firmicutes bacterium]|nr:hypothetical protein [Bacillota bacterium]
MKSTILKITGSIIMLLCIFFFTTPALASSPNFATSTEHVQLYFNGYVQIQSSYIENGAHAYQGWFVYRNGLTGEQWRYTSVGQSPHDSTIRSNSMTYLDHPNPAHPPVTFNYNFTWIPHGTAWPLSVDH